MLFIFIDIFGTVLDVLAMLSFFGLVAPKKDVKTSIRAIVILGATTVRYIIGETMDEVVVLGLVAFVSYLVIMCLYTGNIIRKVLSSLLLNVFFVLSEMIVGLILSSLSSMTVEQLTNNVFFYIQGALMSKLMVLVIVKSVSHFSKPSESKTSNAFYIMLMIHPFATFLVVFVMSEYMYESNKGEFIGLSAIAVIILIVSNVLLFYLFEHYQKLVEEKTKQQMIERDLEYKAEYYKDLSNRQKITNKTMHNLKNQLFALKESLQISTDEGIKKINMLCDDILLSNAMEYTGIEAIDALITVKKQRMDEMNIKFKPSIYMANGNKFDAFDMCILLGNLLDNAIEANEKIDEEKRCIELCMKQSETYLSIQINNVVNEEISICDNKIVTSKEKKELHGYGLQSVEEIAKKYNGSCVFKQEGEWFKAILRLENN